MGRWTEPAESSQDTGSVPRTQLGKRDTEVHAETLDRRIAAQEQAVRLSRCLPEFVFEPN